MEFSIPFEQLLNSNRAKAQRANINTPLPLSRMEGDNESEIDTQGNINIESNNCQVVDGPAGIDLQDLELN